jgi:hypothetical protein
MATKIIVSGDGVTVKFDKTLDEIKTLEKHNPKALRLFDEDKNEVFRVASISGEGSINAYGATFGSESRDDAKNAILTLIMPSEARDAKAWVEEVIGTAILKLNKVEAQMTEALTQVNSDLAAVRESITVA